jgi:SWI/SNF-related matrix-associated actin-dependent regulator of chromatin subfamily A3
MTCPRTDYSGPGGSSSRWSTPTAPGKTVEVQRAQVDELFKNLRGGEELEETEPRAPIFRVVYHLSDRVLLIQLLKSEPSYIRIRRKR